MGARIVRIAAWAGDRGAAGPCRAGRRFLPAGSPRAMRQAALLTGPVKQIVLLGSNDEVLCPIRARVVRHEVLTSMAVAGSDIVLDVIRLADRSDRFLRIRRPSQPTPQILADPSGGAGAGDLAAATRLEAGRGQPGQARMTMADGTPVEDWRNPRSGSPGHAVPAHHAVEAISAGHLGFDASHRFDRQP